MRRSRSRSSRSKAGAGGRSSADFLPFPLPPPWTPDPRLTILCGVCKNWRAQKPASFFRREDFRSCGGCVGLERERGFRFLVALGVSPPTVCCASRWGEHARGPQDPVEVPEGPGQDATLRGRSWEAPAQPRPFDDCGSESCYSSEPEEESGEEAGGSGAKGSSLGRGCGEEEGDQEDLGRAGAQFPCLTDSTEALP